MSALPDSFRALVAEKQDDDVARGLQDLRADDLPDGDTVVRVEWSSVNYKDALAVSPKGRVAQISPLVPGVDLAGTVVEGAGEGSEVIVHSGRTLPDPRPQGKPGGAGERASKRTLESASLPCLRCRALIPSARSSSSRSPRSPSPSRRRCSSPRSPSSRSR